VLDGAPTPPAPARWPRPCAKRSATAASPSSWGACATRMPPASSGRWPARGSFRPRRVVESARRRVEALRALVPASAGRVEVAGTPATRWRSPRGSRPRRSCASRVALAHRGRPAPRRRKRSTRSLERGPRAWGSFFHARFRASSSSSRAPSWLTAWPPRAGAVVPHDGPDHRREVTVVADRIEQIGADNLVVASGNAELTKGSARFARRPHQRSTRATGDAKPAQGPGGSFSTTARPAHRPADRLHNQDRGPAWCTRASAGHALLPDHGRAPERLGESPSTGCGAAYFTTCRRTTAPSCAFARRFGHRDPSQDSSTAPTPAFLAGRTCAESRIPFFAAAMPRERQDGASWRRQVRHLLAQGRSLRRDAVLLADTDSQDATLSLRRLLATGRRRVGPVPVRDLAEPSAARSAGSFVHESVTTGDTRGLGSRQARLADRRRALRSAPISTRCPTTSCCGSTSPSSCRAAPTRRVESVPHQDVVDWNFVGRAYWYRTSATERPVELQPRARADAAGGAA